MSPTETPLGKPTAYPSRYSPELLVSIPRAAERLRLGIAEDLPFHGADLWTAYELSWLDPRGKPAAAIGRFRIPADSVNIVESKSLKLYLSSLHATRFDDLEAPRALLERDLSRASGGRVGIELASVDGSAAESAGRLPGVCLDDVELDVDTYDLDPGLLSGAARGEVATETLYSHLFKTNCPVTGQPDWASVFVRYRGRAIEKNALLAYLISYRNHAAFHEHCVERIFADLLRYCSPDRLTVYARYTRRGGLDINPFRSNFEPVPRDRRLLRQ